MKTLDQIKSRKSNCIDGRDMTRLMDFIPEDQLKDFGLELKPECVGKHKHKEFTKENILKQLKKDVAFGFEKALDCRGISSSMMYEVVTMWNVILDEGLEFHSDYSMYGLPLFKATAVKYGFPNPIGDDLGNEDKYKER